MSRTLTFPVRFLAVWPLDFFQAFVVFFFWWFRAAGFRKLFGGGFDVQTPYFGSITATQLCYLGKGREVALQLSTSFLEIAKAKWQLWMERQSCFFIRLFTETRRPANLKRTVLGYCDTPL
jgi:hypothetical protein